MKRILIIIFILVFFYPPVYIFAGDIDKLEYFIDTDPGYGQGVDVPVTAGGDITVDFNVDVAGIDIGFHRIYVRGRDSDGHWSLTHSFRIYKHANRTVESTPDIVKVEYALDSDFTFENSVDVPVSPGDRIITDFQIDLSGLPLGNHPIHIRAQDETGAWSLTQIRTLYNYTVAHYPMNGNASDDSGFGNQGTAAGAVPATDVFGVSGSAYELDGVDDYIDISPAQDDINPENNTVLMWFKPTVGLDADTGEPETPGVWPPPAARVLFAQKDRWIIFYNQGNLVFSAATAGGLKTVYYRTDFLEGQWRYLAAVYSMNDTLRLYLDGLLAGSISAYNEPILTDGVSLNIGTAGTTGYFRGTVDEVAILNHALSDTEAADLFYSLQPISITPPALTVGEPSGTADFFIRLAKQPSVDVTVNLASSNPGEFSLSNESVTFDAQNWETGETVSITAEQDGIYDGEQPASVITFAAIGDDPSAGGFDPIDVKVTVLDDTAGPGIDSVYPALGEADQPLDVTATGIGFSAGTLAGLVPYPAGGAAIDALSVTLIDENTLSLTLPGSAAGDYSLKVWEGAGEYIFPNAITFQADPAPMNLKKAVIVAGSGPYRGNLLWDGTAKCADLAFYTFYTQGYGQDNIQYLGPAAYRDVNGDGSNDVDGNIALSSLQNAITSWAVQGSPDELFVYLTGNGINGYFELDGGTDPKVMLSAQTLDQWLDMFQTSTGARVFLLYDACRAGSFMPLLKPPQGCDRIVMTGASTDERAFFLDDGEISFSYLFWTAMLIKGELFDSYDIAGGIMNQVQTPQMDANGDGTADIRRKRSDAPIVIGRGRFVDTSPPRIGTASATPQLLDTGSTVSHLETSLLEADNGVSRVWGRILPPSMMFDSLNEPVVVLPTCTLIENGGVYANDYEDFIYNGRYDIFIYAKDLLDYQSLPGLTDVTQTQGMALAHDPVCDINGDGWIDLQDIIIILKITAGLDVAGAIRDDYPAPAFDVEGDFNIGIAEALNVLIRLSL